VLERPEGGSFVALVDVRAADADAAVAAALGRVQAGSEMAAVKVITPNRRPRRLDRPQAHTATRPLRTNGATSSSTSGGANDILDRRRLRHGARCRRKKRGRPGRPDLRQALAEGLTSASRSQAGRPTPSTARAFAELGRFVDRAMKATQVPGVSLGPAAGGKVVFSGGAGVRELGKPARRRRRHALHDRVQHQGAGHADAGQARRRRGKIGWDTAGGHVVLPSFKLGDAATTNRVLVKHLICACTGMPRQDLEWLLEFKDLTPAGAMDAARTMQPTSGFGDLFQYSNPMAAAAGYLGGPRRLSRLELGAPTTVRCRPLVFTPLGMANTTHDFAVARRGNAAVRACARHRRRAGAGRRSCQPFDVPVRPRRRLEQRQRHAQVRADGARRRALPDGTRYIAQGRPAGAARSRRSASATTSTYGMGLMVDTTYGIAGGATTAAT
jgi:hypothetical protein